MQPAAVRHTPESHNMLILLDQDNVLADFESGFRRHWRNRFGEDAPIEGKEHLFYIRDRLPEHLQAYAAELYGTVGFFESLPPVSGAVEAAHALLAAGHDMRICTAPVNQYRLCRRKNCLGGAAFGHGMDTARHHRQRQNLGARRHPYRRQTQYRGHIAAPMAAPSLRCAAQPPS